MNTLIHLSNTGRFGEWDIKVVFLWWLLFFFLLESRSSANPHQWWGPIKSYWASRKEQKMGHSLLVNFLEREEDGTQSSLNIEELIYLENTEGLADSLKASCQATRMVWDSSHGCKLSSSHVSCLDVRVQTKCIFYNYLVGEYKDKARRGVAMVLILLMIVRMEVRTWNGWVVGFPTSKCQLNDEINMLGVVSWATSTISLVCSSCTCCHPGISTELVSTDTQQHIQSKIPRAVLWSDTFWRL